MKNKQDQEFFLNALEFHKNEKLDNALEYYQKALAHNPELFEACANIGLLYKTQGDTEATITWYERAVALQPDGLLYTSLARMYREKGSDEKAFEYYRQLHKLEPCNKEALFWLGKYEYDHNQLEEAERLFKSLVHLDATISEAWQFLGRCIGRSPGRVQEAEKYLRKGLELQPKSPYAHSFLCENLLVQGKFSEGWTEYEWRIHRGETRKIYEPFSLIPRWKGDIFSRKKLLVHFEQGFGDSIQFCRYLPLVKERGGWVTFLVQPGLVRLMHQCAGADWVVDKVSLTDYDFAIPIMSLPYLFGTTLQSIPGGRCYLTVNHEWGNPWENILHSISGFKVGLVWAGNTYQGTIKDRTSHLRYLRPLFKCNKQVTFISLQKGEAAEQLNDKELVDIPIVNLADNVRDFADTAAIIANLDLVISVDTAVAHLAGALGKPVWTVLPYRGEWRWLLDRQDSPWYPTMRLFRQPSPGDWDEVYRLVAEALYNSLGNVTES